MVLQGMLRWVLVRQSWFVAACFVPLCLGSYSIVCRRMSCFGPLSWVLLRQSRLFQLGRVPVRYVVAVEALQCAVRVGKFCLGSFGSEWHVGVGYVQFC